MLQNKNLLATILKQENKTIYVTSKQGWSYVENLNWFYNEEEAWRSIHTTPEVAKKEKEKCYELKSGYFYFHTVESYTMSELLEMHTKEAVKVAVEDKAAHDGRLKAMVGAAVLRAEVKLVVQYEKALESGYKATQLLFEKVRKGE